MRGLRAVVLGLAVMLGAAAGRIIREIWASVFRRTSSMPLRRVEMTSFTLLGVVILEARIGRRTRCVLARETLRLT